MQPKVFRCYNNSIHQKFSLYSLQASLQRGSSGSNPKQQWITWTSKLNIFAFQMFSLFINSLIIPFLWYVCNFCSISFHMNWKMLRYIVTYSVLSRGASSKTVYFPYDLMAKLGQPYINGQWPMAKLHAYWRICKI